MINESPRVTNDSVEAEFQITRPVTGVRCFLRSQIDRIWQNCTFFKLVCFNEVVQFIVIYTRHNTLMLML